MASIIYDCQKNPPMRPDAWRNAEISLSDHGVSYLKIIQNSENFKWNSGCFDGEIFFCGAYKVLIIHQKFWLVFFRIFSTTNPFLIN